MERREFIQRGATLAGGATLLGFTPAKAGADQRNVAPELAALGSRVADAPPPISESEREQRRDKAQRLMKELGYSAMLIEPGPNMVYFSGIEWGRSERLFALILPQSGKGIVIAPAFEKGRAADQVNGRFDIRVWQEDESPEVLVASPHRFEAFEHDRLLYRRALPWPEGALLKVSVGPEFVWTTTVERTLVDWLLVSGKAQFRATVDTEVRLRFAADTGGAIKGQRIDLGFNSKHESNRLGRRNVKVHILQ